MEEFLNALKEYELLLELILTAASLFISVFVVFQTKNLAKSQAKQNIEIAERQAKQEREIADRQNQLQKWQVKQEREIAEQQNELQRWQVKQEREIAEQQNELQKRQIRLELFDKKWVINNALLQVFSFANEYVFAYKKYKDGNFDYDKLVELLLMQKEKSGFNSLEALIYQGMYIISKEKYNDIILVKIFYEAVSYRIQELDSKDSFKYKETLNDIYTYCERIREFEEVVSETFAEELNIVRIDK